MAQKTYKQIQDEANRLFGKGASDKKFEWRRQQQAEAGLELEKKTRGGVAGAYDRNKKLVQAAVPMIAGALIPGSAMLAGSIAGGLSRGLDRPGKSGIGLDLGEAAKGAFTGAVMGRAGQVARTGVGNLLARRGAEQAATPAVVDTVTKEPVKQAGNIFSRAGETLMKKPEIAAAGLNAYTTARQGAANREIQRQQMAQSESQFGRTFGQSEEERKREIERQQRIAQMLAPLFQRISGGQG